MTTIANIAKKTKLGYSTVAQIMQGRSNYRADTIARVMAAAKELGYMPNYLSKSLAGGKSMSIGIYIESTSSSVSTHILYPLESKAWKAGYMTYIVSGLWEDRVMSQLRNLQQRKIDGLIYHSTVPHNSELIDFFRKLQIPVVFIDRPVLDEHPATVGIDYSDALNSLAETLQGYGYRRAQLLYNDFFLDYPKRLQEPYRLALETVGIALDVSNDWCARWNSEAEIPAYEIVTANLKSGNIPELLLCYNDQAAIGAIAAIRDAGLNVPEDIGVVGRDGLSLLKYMRPSLTSLVRPQGEIIAETAFSMLLQMINTSGFVPEPVQLPISFERGGTICQR